MNDWRDLNHDGKVDGLDYLIYEDINKNANTVNTNYSKKGTTGFEWLIRWIIVIAIVSIIGCVSEGLGLVAFILLIPFFK